MKKCVSRLLGSVLLTLALVGCGGSGGPDHSPNRELKLYKVPVQQSSQIERALSVLLAGNGKNSAGVTQPFPGTLMVLAPPSLQASVAKVMTELGKTSASTNASETLQVHFWIVAAVPGQGKDSAALKPVGKTLDHLRGLLGPSHFLLDAAVSAAGTMGEQGQIMVNGVRAGQFRFKAMPGQGGAIKLWAAYDNHANAAAIGDVSTTVTLAPGQYVMLAQAPVPEQISGRKLTLNGEGKPKLTLFDSQGRPVDGQKKPNMQLLVVSVDRPASTSR